MASLRDQIALWNYGGRVKTKSTPVAETSQEIAESRAGDVVPAETMEAISAPSGNAQVAPKGQGSAFYGLKTRLHQKLLTRIDLAAAETLSPEQLRTQLRDLVAVLIDEDSLPVNEKERSQLVTELQNEIMGLGPLEPLLADPTISEIMVNGYQKVYIERRGQIELSKVRFNDDAHLLKIIDKIVSRVGRRIDESSPMADARLPDGSRVNAIIPPLALDGPSVSIRRFAVVPLQMKDLIAKKALTAGMAELLAGMVKAKTNIVISGGTGSGKTTLLNILSSYIPGNERIITIEDTAELQLQQDHVVRLETRPPNIEGKGEIPMRLLVKNSLRMRPDRIVLGEVRGGEVIDMLQAMNTGHDGSLTTVHANSPRDALARLENLVGMGGVNLPAKALRQLIASSINVIVQATRLNDGSRKITSVQEITGMEGDVITSQEIFYFERLGVNPDGSVIGRFRATGVRPLMAEKLRTYGVNLSEDLFDPSRPLE
jgi:pilus assembly protein CpaF